jgi:hypothetical protein
MACLCRVKCLLSSGGRRVACFVCSESETERPATLSEPALLLPAGAVGGMAVCLLPSSQWLASLHVRPVAYRPPTRLDGWPATDRSSARKADGSCSKRPAQGRQVSLARTDDSAACASPGLNRDDMT